MLLLIAFLVLLLSFTCCLSLGHNYDDLFALDSVHTWPFSCFPLLHVIRHQKTGFTLEVFLASVLCKCQSFSYLKKTVETELLNYLSASSLSSFILAPQPCKKIFPQCKSDCGCPLKLNHSALLYRMRYNRVSNKVFETFHGFDPTSSTLISHWAPRNLDLLEVLRSTHCVSVSQDVHCLCLECSP